MTTTTDPQPSIVLAKPSRDVVKGARWWRELGWRYLVGIAVTVVVAIPLLYIVSASINPVGSVSSTKLIPDEISFRHFEALGNNPARPFWKWLMNSLIVAAVVVTVNSFLSSLGAYAFSRLRFMGRRAGLLALLLIQMFPGVLIMVALFRMFGIIGEAVPGLGLDTLAGYTFMLLGGALGGVFLMKGMFDAIPQSLDEAAKIDGAGHFRVYFTVIMPLVKSILVINGLLALTGVIGEFLLASIFLRSDQVKTVAVGLYGVLTSDRANNLGWFCAAALVISVPVVLLFQWLQKYIVGGISAGAVKG